MKKIFKKILASLLSVTLLFTVEYSSKVQCMHAKSEIVTQDVPLINLGSLQISKDEISRTIKYNTSKINIKLGNYTISLHKLSLSVLGAGLILVGLKFINDFIEKSNDIFFITHRATTSDFSKKFGSNVTKIKLYTTTQEGIGWCWLACLQGLMRYHKIEKGQEEIFKGITNSSSISPLQTKRSQGLAPFTSKANMKNFKHLLTIIDQYIYSKMVFFGEIKDYIEKISNKKLTYQILYLNKGLNDTEAKNAILDIYKKIGNIPFSIYANHVNVGHFVNVSKIDGDGTMYIEDPGYVPSQARKESIDDFVKNYDNNLKNLLNQFNGLFLGFIVEKGKTLNDSPNHDYITAESIEGNKIITEADLLKKSNSTPAAAQFKISRLSV